MKLLNIFKHNYLSIIFISVASILIFLYLYMVSQLYGRQVFIDEMIYSGDWFLNLRNAGINFFEGRGYWFVESKQPLFFWIYELLYEILPIEFANGPYFLGLVPRLQSAFYIFTIPFILYFTQTPSSSRMILFALSFCLVLTSPFFLVHSQLGIVEPFLVVVFFLSMNRLFKLLHVPSAKNFTIYTLCLIALVLTKSNAIIVIVAGAVSFSLLSAIYKEKRKVFILIALVHVAIFFFSQWYIDVHPEIAREQNRVINLSQASLSQVANLGRNLLMHIKMSTYYNSYLTLAFLFLGLITLLYHNIKKKHITIIENLSIEKTSFILMLIFISVVSITATSLIEPLPNVPRRYYLFSFMPLVFLAYIIAIDVIQCLEKLRFTSKRILSSLIIFIVLLDIFSTHSIFFDFSGKNTRIDDFERQQYYSIWALGSAVTLAKRMKVNNSVIYGLGAPYYGDLPKTRMALGVKDAFTRTRLLPKSKDKVNLLTCNPNFGETLVMITPNYWDNQPGNLDFNTLELVLSFTQLQKKPYDYTTYVYKKLCVK